MSSLLSSEIDSLGSIGAGIFLVDLIPCWVACKWPYAVASAFWMTPYYSDATGALPVRGRSGALYQIVFFHEDSNFIHIEVSKSRKGPDLLASLQRAIKFFTARGVSPLIIRMDNECAKDTKTWLATTPTQLKLTPGLAASYQQSGTGDWYLERSFYRYSSHCGP